MAKKTHLALVKDPRTWVDEVHLVRCDRHGPLLYRESDGEEWHVRGQDSVYDFCSDGLMRATGLALKPGEFVFVKIG